MIYIVKLESDTTAHHDLGISFEALNLYPKTDSYYWFDCYDVDSLDELLICIKDFYE